MINPISSISTATSLLGAVGPAPTSALAGQSASTSTAGAGASGQSFGQMLESAIGQVNNAQLHAADLRSRFAAGEPMDVHKVMIAGEEASVALNLAVQVRNKITDGYTQLMQVSI